MQYFPTQDNISRKSLLDLKENECGMAEKDPSRRRFPLMRAGLTLLSCTFLLINILTGSLLYPINSLSLSLSSGLNIRKSRPALDAQTGFSAD